MKILFFLVLISSIHICPAFVLKKSVSLKRLYVVTPPINSVISKTKKRINKEVTPPINSNQLYRTKRSTLWRVHLYPKFLKRIISPLENEKLKRYFFFRSLSRVCVSLSSTFSINAKLQLYGKNADNIILTQLLINNEVFVKILKVFWLYKLSYLIDKKIRLCRYLSTLLYIGGTYIDILSTYNLSKNIHFSFALFSLSSILKHLSMLTYASIKSSVNYHLADILYKERIKERFQQEQKEEEKQAKEKEKEQELTDVEKDEREENEKEKKRERERERKEPYSNVSKGNRDGYVNKRYDEYLVNDEKKKVVNALNNSINNTKGKQINIGEISALSDLFFSLVDLCTVFAFSHLTKYIKQKLYFYIALSITHLFVSYKELESLLE